MIPKLRTRSPAGDHQPSGVFTRGVLRDPFSIYFCDPTPSGGIAESGAGNLPMPCMAQCLTELNSKLALTLVDFKRSAF